MVKRIDDFDIPGDVISAWIGGNERAFAVIVKSTMKRSYSIALGLLGNPDDALEVSQEAYMAAHTARKKFDPSRPFFPWFYRILRNRCLNFLDKRVRRREVSLEVVSDREDRENDPELACDRKIIAASVWKALFSIPAEHREIIVLRSFQGMSYREIADVLGIPEGTVMSRLFYARSSLRSALESFPELVARKESSS